MALFEPLRRGAEEFVDTLSEGWDRLRDASASALTRFRGPGKDDDSFPERIRGDRWGLLSTDIAETDDDVVVRIEAPGLEEKDFSVTVLQDQLVVRGESALSARTRRQSTISSNPRTAPLNDASPCPAR